MNKFNLEIVKKKRLKLNKTMQEMAVLLGMKNASTYLKYETGVYAFKADQLPLLANALECDISNFFA